jgi:glycine/D-amino acid oxidase-like deaminating enzyme
MSHVVVIGAGVFGVWTAHHLSAAGHTVTLVDAYGPGNSRSSSGDESRIVRCGYGRDEIYTQFAIRSLEFWRDLGARAAGDFPLFHPCGVLWLAPADDAYTAATRRTLERGPYALSVLNSADLRRRVPHIQADDVAHALLEDEAGVVMARRAVQTIANGLAARGVKSVRARVVPASLGAGALGSVPVSEGPRIDGDVFVFACGAWLPRVFPELLTGIIRPTRQVVVYFGTPAGDDRFGPARMPAWIDFPNGIYGIPDLEGRGLKVGIDRHGPGFDPDDDDRVADEASVRAARGWLARRIPALADAPVIESRVCQYENTSTGDFLIDWHPDHENALIVGGGSGHGFKHGPAVGEYVARLLETREPTQERFSLATKTTAAQRAVY